MILSESEAKTIFEKHSKLSKADAVSFRLRGSNSNNVRFALNSLSTNGFSDGLSLEITSYIGKKTGSSRTNNFDDASIKRAIEISENIARLSPDNPEFVPVLDKQTYQNGINYFANTAQLDQKNRATMVKNIIDMADSSSLSTAGFLENAESFTSIYNTNGLFAYNKETYIDFSATMRTPDGTGSSRVQKLYSDSDKLNIKTLGERAVNRSKLSANPTRLEPGKYTVILEPDAAADMIAYLFWFIDARSADEGRSFFSKPGGGNLMGEKFVSDKVNIYSDPFDANVPADPFNDEGFPLQKRTWINNGVLETMTRGRYWAAKNNQEVVPFPSNIIMQGSDKSTEQLISETEDGVLVSRLWYIRTVDPKTILLTGLTRDGIFKITNGKIERPVNNFRFNESPVNILKNVIDFGRSEKASGSETAEMNTFVPALKIKDFNFSSISDAV